MPLSGTHRVVWAYKNRLSYDRRFFRSLYSNKEARAQRKSVEGERQAASKLFFLTTASCQANRIDLPDGSVFTTNAGSSERSALTPVWPLWSCRVCMPFFLYVPYHSVCNVQFYCIYYNISPIKFFIFGNFTLAIYAHSCKIIFLFWLRIRGHSPGNSCVSHLFFQ